MYGIDFHHDGDGGGFYKINGTRINDNDIIIVNGTEIKAKIKKIERKEHCHNDSWTSCTYELFLPFEISGLLCSINKTEYSKKIFTLKSTEE